MAISDARNFSAHAPATPKESDSPRLAVANPRFASGVFSDPGASEPWSTTAQLFTSTEAADWIVACLERAGVEYVFGVPGGAVEPIYNALARSSRRGGPRPVVARHESGAAFMADGYARETGKLGVCLATSGPGATNLITGVACAYENSVPLLALTGQPALPNFGKRALQESSCTGVDIVAMFSKCTRFNSLVSHPDQVETKLTSAILHAMRKPHGPAHLSFPVDILRSTITSRNPAYDLSALVGRPSRLTDDWTIAALVRDLLASSRPIFLIGSGAAEAVDSIMSLIRLTGAPFITTPDAKGFINPFHHAYRGVFGLGGHESATELLRSGTDLVVAFGTGFGEFASGGWSQLLLNHRLVHVDDSEENLVHSPMARLHVRGCMRAICAKVNAELSERIATDSSRCPVSERREKAQVKLDSPEMQFSDAVPIKPQRLMKELSDRFPVSTRFVVDAGNSMIWAPHYLQPQDRREHGDRRYRAGVSDERPNRAPAERRSNCSSWLRLALEFAPMGWAIGAAVGIARANARGPVVCITGDGSYLMSGQEISTAAEERLPIVYVILNDHAYGMVMHGQRLAGAEPIAFELPRIDFCKMAEAVSVPAHVIESPADFDLIDFDEVLSRKGPTLLDVRIDRDEQPPMMMRLKTLGSVKA
ncbi:MAG: thiamine pyrophosphate-binding protein [Polyangiaceae bacterium]